MIGAEQSQGFFEAFEEARASGVVMRRAAFGMVGAGHIDAGLRYELQFIPQSRRQGKRRAEPVSYTHLDVYKRQVRSLKNIGMIHPSFANRERSILRNRDSVNVMSLVPPNLIILGGKQQNHVLWRGIQAGHLACNGAISAKRRRHEVNKRSANACCGGYRDGECHPDHLGVPGHEGKKYELQLFIHSYS